MLHVPATGKRKRGLQLLVDGLRQALRGKRRRLQEEQSGSCGGSLAAAASVPLWHALVRGPAHDSFIPCLTPLELARLEAAQRATRELVFGSGGWEVCAERELPPGPLVSFLRRRPDWRHLKAMLAAYRRGFLRPSLEDPGLAAALLQGNSRISLGKLRFSCRRRALMRPRADSGPGAAAPAAGAAAAAAGQRPPAVDWTSRCRSFRSAITSICFGQERLRRAYILLVVAFEDGNAFVLRSHRTPLERAMLSPKDVTRNDSSAFRTALGNMSVLTFHSAICSHRKAITAMFFNKREDRLVTSSLDRKLCVWDVSSGRTYSPLVAVFADSAPILVAVPMPLCEEARSPVEAFVASNGNGVLRAVSLRGGVAMQRFKLSTPVEALRFDVPGRNLLAGTKLGGLHALAASDAGRLTHRFSYQLGCGGVTCITFAPASGSDPARFLAGTAEATVAIADCSYGTGRDAGVLVGLDIRRRVKVAPPSALMACCYSPAGRGHLICGSADGSVSACPLDGRPMERLLEHEAPISGVAVNAQGTILASTDVRGNIVLWRRKVQFPR
uniref:Uncharacterized protein n=1 Tax=Alexandrium monilatum TaxID=311494 RepID=A0A6T1FXM1_9DINO